MRTTFLPLGSVALHRTKCQGLGGPSSWITAANTAQSMSAVSTCVACLLGSVRLDVNSSTFMQLPFIASCKSAWRSCIQSLSLGTTVGMGDCIASMGTRQSLSDPSTEPRSSWSWFTICWLVSGDGRGRGAESAATATARRRSRRASLSSMSATNCWAASIAS